MKLAIPILALSTTLAHAQPAADATERAKQLYAEGKRYYDVADYDRAITIWKEAYVLASAPMLLFNIGQAYRLKGDCANALRFYANYEREEKDPANKVELAQAKERCDREPTDAQNPPGYPPPKDGPPPADAVPATAGDPPTGAAPATGAPSTTGSASLTGTGAPIDRGAGGDGFALRATGVATGVGGAVLVVTGVFLASRAGDYATQVEAFRGEWTTAERALEDKGKSAALWSKVTIGVGAAAIVTGGVLYIIGARAGREARGGVGVAIVPGHAEVMWSTAF